MRQHEFENRQQDAAARGSDAGHHGRHSRSSSLRRRISLLAAAAVFGVSVTATANGRYPAASQIVVDPNDPNHLVVAATFGFLDSRDGGRNFNWLCEQAVGVAGEEGFDIVLTVTGNGN